MTINSFSQTATLVTVLTRPIGPLMQGRAPSTKESIDLSSPIAEQHARLLSLY